MPCSTWSPPASPAAAPPVGDRIHRPGTRSTRRPPARSAPTPRRPNRRRSRRPRVRLGSAPRRLRLTLFLLSAVAVLFAARLVQLQGLDASAYAAQAERHPAAHRVLPAERGTITDRNGVELATSVETTEWRSTRCCCGPRRKLPAAAVSLAPVLEEYNPDVREQLGAPASGSSNRQECAPGTRSARSAPSPRSTGMPGIFGEQTSRRVYPAGDGRRNVVGYRRRRGEGLGGHRVAQDGVLAGRDGTATYEQSGGRTDPRSGVDTSATRCPARDVRLTIDRDIQYVAQQAIAAQVAASGAVAAPSSSSAPTGELLAVATAPTFDPNTPGATPEDPRQPPRLTEAYEPGSTGKVITASAAASRRASSRPTTPITVPNRLTRADKTFKDFEDPPGAAPDVRRDDREVEQHRHHPRRRADATQTSRTTYRRFGIGEPTGLGLPGEAPGMVPSPSTGRRPAATR